MEKLTPELIKELEYLREFKRKVTGNLTFDALSKGGKVIGNRLHKCPNCGREIKGNSGFGQHLKKCNKTLDK